MSSNKLWKGMLIGAVVGGAVTLFDKEVRRQVATDSKRVGNQIKKVVTNPQQTVACVQNKINQFSDAYKNLNEDLQFITEKAAEIKELSRETAETVNEIKQVSNKEFKDFTPPN